MKYVWVIVLVICIVAAGSVWFAFQRPDFVAGLVAIAAAAAWQAFGPSLAKRMTPEDEAAWHQAIREGRETEWRNERARKKLKPWFTSH